MTNNTSNHFTATLLVIVVSILMLTSAASAMTREEFLTKLTAIEQSYRTAKLTYQVHRYHGNPDSENEPLDLGDEGEVEAEFGMTPKYHADIRSNSTEGGEFVQKRWAASFDGYFARTLSYRKTKKGFAPEKGRVSAGFIEFYFRMNVAGPALRLTTQCFEGCGLSGFLNALDHPTLPPWRIEEVSDAGVVTIWYPEWRGSGTQTSYLIEVDFEKDGNIVGFEHWIGSEESGARLMEKMDEMQFETVDGVLVPTRYRILRINGFTEDQRRHNTEYSVHTLNWESINHTPATSAFELEFPRGTEVNNPWARRTFFERATNALNRGAMDIVHSAFPKAFEPTRDNQGFTPTNPWRSRLILFGFPGIVIALIAVWFLRRKKTRP